MERSFEEIFINALVASLEKHAEFGATHDPEGGPDRAPSKSSSPEEVAAKSAKINSELPFMKRMQARLGKGVEAVRGAASRAHEAVKPAGTKVKELWQSGKAGKGLLIGGGAAAAGGLGLTGAALINALRNKKKKEEAA